MKAEMGIIRNQKQFRQRQREAVSLEGSDSTLLCIALHRATVLYSAQHCSTQHLSLTHNCSAMLYTALHCSLLLHYSMLKMLVLTKLCFGWIPQYQIKIKRICKPGFTRDSGPQKNTTKAVHRYISCNPLLFGTPNSPFGHVCTVIMANLQPTEWLTLHTPPKLTP